MGWFCRGYPHKPQWNGIWRVVCDRLGQEKGGAGPQFGQYVFGGPNDLGNASMLIRERRGHAPPALYIRLGINK
jgi:hypothetical protein